MSHETRSKLMKLCRKAYGHDLELVDAKTPLRVQPEPCDVEGADPKALDNCVFVHTVERMYHCKIPTVFKRYAYFDLVGQDGVVRFVRHAATKALTDALSDFDRGKPFPVGKAFFFLPIPEHSKLENIRADKLRWRKSKKGKAFYEVGLAMSRRVAAVRRVEKTQETLADAKREAAPISPKVKQARMHAASAKADLATANENLRKAETRKAKVTVSRGPGSRHPKPRKFDLSTRNGAIGNYNFITI